MTLGCQLPSGLLELSTGAISRAAAVVRLTPTSATPGHLPGTTCTAPGPGKSLPLASGSCPEDSGVGHPAQHKGGFSQKNPPGFAPLPPPTLRPPGHLNHQCPGARSAAGG